MSPSEYSVRRPVTIVMVYALAIGIAFTLVPRIAVDLYPSIARPEFSIYTSFPGAGPEDVERNLTEPLEKALASSKFLTRITSSSSFETSNIVLEFAYGTDMDKAIVDAQTLVNRLTNSLPDDAGNPTVRRFNLSAMPIMRLVVRGSYPPDQLRRFAEDEIQPELERVEGVAAADVTGGAAQMIKVEVALNRLAAFNLNLSDVTSALRGQNILTSGGSITRGIREYQLMSSQELTDISQVNRIAVKTVSSPSGSENRSRVVRIEDIADVSLGYDENATRVYVNGQSGVYIRITSENETNQVQVARRVRELIGDINTRLPRGITLVVLSDNTTMIEATLNQVYFNALQGGLLAMLILFLFLRNVKGTLIIGLSIPICIILTLMCMQIFGFTLNLLTMTGLIMGLGMTVDASIVILENVHSYRQRGAKASVAAILGSREMIRAIVASTATTVCVFIPLIIYKNDLEWMGLFFNDLIFTVIISLMCSLIVAITLVPVLCGPVLNLNTRKQKPLQNKLLKLIDDKMEDFFVSLDNAYKKALDYCLDHRAIVVIFITLILVYSLMQFSNVGLNVSFRTRVDDNVDINVTLPRGSTIDYTEGVLRDLENLIREKVEGFTNIVLTARRSSGGGGGGRGTQGAIQITLPPPSRQIDTPDTIQRKLRPFTSSVPGASFAFRAGRGMGTTQAVEIAVSSRNYELVMDTANDILGIITRRLPEVENPAINLDEGAPQLNIRVDRDRAAAMGVSIAAVAQEIKTAMNGTTATSMIVDTRYTDINVMLRKQDREGLPNLDAIFLMSRSGARIPLSNLASITEERAPSTIRRENRERVVRVTGDLAPGIAATDFQKILEATVHDNLVFREGVTIRYLGEAAEAQSFLARYGMIIAVAVFLVFGVMASQFESFVDPLIIFFSIPLLFIGVIWIYKIGNQPLSLFSVVGVIALIGVVVNNGIVLVDYTNTLCARGMKVREACVEAGRNRLRPILMTTLTTILGMAPIAFFPGQGADTIQPIGKTFVGGLTINSVMTLFLTPVLYSLFNSRHDKKRMNGNTG